MDTSKMYCPFCGYLGVVPRGINFHCNNCGGDFDDEGEAVAVDDVPCPHGESWVDDYGRFWCVACGARVDDHSAEEIPGSWTPPIDPADEEPRGRVF